MNLIAYAHLHKLTTMEVFEEAWTAFVQTPPDTTRILEDVRKYHATGRQPHYVLHLLQKHGLALARVSNGHHFV